VKNETGSESCPKQALLSGLLNIQVVITRTFTSTNRNRKICLPPTAIKDYTFTSRQRPTLGLAYPRDSDIALLRKTECVGNAAAFNSHQIIKITYHLFSSYNQSIAAKPSLAKCPPFYSPFGVHEQSAPRPYRLKVGFLYSTHSKSATYIPHNTQHAVNITLLREFQPSFLDLRKEYEFKMF
jgi:hypothetical protein